MLMTLDRLGLLVKKNTSNWGSIYIFIYTHTELLEITTFEKILYQYQSVNQYIVVFKTPANIVFIQNSKNISSKWIETFSAQVFYTFSPNLHRLIIFVMTQTAT